MINPDIYKNPHKMAVYCQNNDEAIIVRDYLLQNYFRSFTKKDGFQIDIFPYVCLAGNEITCGTMSYIMMHGFKPIMFDDIFEECEMLFSEGYQ